MTFGQAFRTCLTKYLVFSGRASRSEFWFFALFVFLCKTAAAAVDSAIWHSRIGNGPFSTIVLLALFLPQISVQVRRLHDTDRSGWWLLAFLVPTLLAFLAYPASLENPALNAVRGVAIIAAIVSFITLIVWFVVPGTIGSNRFGPDPLTSAVQPSPTPEQLA
jgi:uncharacterized membrane protein YhaH (DUF805 family)